jgi:hypothetical protein
LKIGSIQQTGTFLIKKVDSTNGKFINRRKIQKTGNFFNKKDSKQIFGTIVKTGNLNLNQKFIN